ncbi:MAG TPA: GNAT family N-acetyltransferase [Jatrophihabitans sp.]|nr:GNAT family N-acetyltransferase [Jatrophihabitans sp.]
MGWSFTEDPEAFIAAVRPMLLADPVSNTVALSVLDTVRAGHRWSPEEPLTFAWHADPAGAVLMTPPYGLLLAQLPAGTEHDLVAGLHERGLAVPDAGGTVEAVERFSSCWLAGTELTTTPVFRQRLYRLATLRPPEPMPAGAARRATEADLDLVMAWLHAFRAESEPLGAPPTREMAGRRVGLGLVRLWQDGHGAPVSLAGRNPVLGGASRIGPVYTPPERRRHGYAAAVAAAVSQDALDDGAEQVLLFTDLANPTANGVYRRLGYVGVQDRLVLRYC